MIIKITIEIDETAELNIEEKKESNKDKIYHLVCSGKYASEIAKELKPSRAYICKILKELEQKGYIECKNKKKIPKYYKQTKKTYA